MTYEVRFQTVDPERRSEYVKHYKEAIQASKQAGCRGGLTQGAECVLLVDWRFTSVIAGLQHFDNLEHPNVLRSESHWH